MAFATPRGGGVAVSAALVRDLAPPPDFTAVTFAARASRPEGIVSRPAALRADGTAVEECSTPTPSAGRS